MESKICENGGLTMTETSVPPILIDFPHQFETARLLLRLPLPGDGTEVNRAIRESMEQLRPWMIWAQRDQTVEETEANIRQAHIDFLARKDLRMHAFHKETGELVLCTGMHRIDWNIRRFEIGYWVRQKYAGLGLVTEAVDGLTRFMIEHLQANRIEIRCDAKNTRSAKVAERCGFLLEGTLRHNSLSADGQTLRDTLIFAKVRGLDY
jgi:RimJ/RimL family protein N-acetyltransferase